MSADSSKELFLDVTAANAISRSWASSRPLLRCFRLRGPSRIVILIIGGDMTKLRLGEEDLSKTWPQDIITPDIKLQGTIPIPSRWPMVLETQNPITINPQSTGAISSLKMPNELHFERCFLLPYQNETTRSTRNNVMCSYKVKSAPRRQYLRGARISAMRCGVWRGLRYYG